MYSIYGCFGVLLKYIICHNLLLAGHRLKVYVCVLHVYRCVPECVHSICYDAQIRWHVCIFKAIYHARARTKVQTKHNRKKNMYKPRDGIRVNVKHMLIRFKELRSAITQCGITHSHNYYFTPLESCFFAHNSLLYSVSCAVLAVAVAVVVVFLLFLALLV